MDVNKRTWIFRMLLAGIAAGVFCLACMKEQGTYDYTKINEIKIDTILPRTIEVGEILSIAPTFTQTIPVSDDSLEFTWYWYKFGYNLTDTLSTERELHYTVPYTTELGTYFTVLQIKDMRSGVFYKWNFNVTVTSSSTEGVLVLSDLDGVAEVSMLNSANNFVEGLYKSANGEPAGRNPVHIGMIKVNAVPYLNSIVIFCDDNEGGAISHHLDFRKLYSYKEFFFVPPSVIKPQAYYNGITGLDARYDFIINNDQLHVREYRNAQRSDEKTFFKPQTLPLDAKIAKSAIINGTTLLFYDNTNYKFVMVGVTSLQYLSPSYIPVFIGTQDPATMHFDPNDVGLEQIHMNFGWKNTGYGIFRDPHSGELYCLNFSIASLAFNTPFSAYSKRPILNAPFIETATDYAYSILDPYIFYAKDDKLYRYDVEFDRTEVVYEVNDVIPGSQIDKLYFRYYAGQTVYSNRLYLGSSEVGKSGKNGSLHVLRIDRNGTVSEVDSIYRNVSGRVVSMDYKF